MLDPDSNKIEGLAFIGLCLTRNHSEDSHAWTVVDITEDTSAIRNDWEKTNSLSITRQKAYDFNAVQDRNYTFLQSTNDDGWLVGGGEPKSSYKLPSIDSAHIGK